MALAGIFSMFGEKGQKVASVLATIGGVLRVYWGYLLGLDLTIIGYFYTMDISMFG